MIFIFKKAKDGEQNSFGQEQIHFGDPEIILNDKKELVFHKRI